MNTEGTGGDPQAAETRTSETRSPSAEDIHRGFLAREERKKGGFGLGFYGRYFKAMRGITFAGPVLLLLIVVENFFPSGFRWLVGMWVEGCAGASCEGKSDLEISVRRIMHGASDTGALVVLAGFVAVSMIFRAASWTLVPAFLANGGRHLHNAMVASFSRVRVTFFDENPTGRLIRRFSGDYGNLKGEIPNYVSDITGCTAELVWIVGLVLVQAPAASLACVPCGFLYLRTSRVFRPASREVQRLTKVLETPIWSLFTETVVGYQTIRAYGRGQDFIGRLERLYERYAYGILTQSRMTRWLNLRLKFTSELFGLCIILFIAHACANGRMGVGTAGFLMSLTIGLDATMQWLTRSFSLIESTMVSLERVLEYRDLPPEAPAGGHPARAADVMRAERAPGRGVSIAFEDYAASYRPDLPEILGGVTLTISAGSRVGLIGRTGAGKSSLFQALFRMLAVRRGRILVNGMDLGTLPVEDARSLFGIIPQEPHLFSGSVRYNLDRTGQWTDARLWEALVHVRLDAFVRALPGGLDFGLQERGGNLSVGQRQLLCMARTLLLDAPIILMDEATASVDLETDSAITAASREVFAGRTVLVIAHRLETVHDCDSLVVLSRGTVVDQGPPRDVLPRFSRAGTAGDLADLLG